MYNKTEANNLFIANTRAIRQCMAFIFLTRQDKFEDLKQQINCLFDNLTRLYNDFLTLKQSLPLDTPFADIFETMLSALTAREVQEDYLYLADILELQAIPILKNIQMTLIEYIDIFTSDSTIYELNMKYLNKIPNNFIDILKENAIHDESRYFFEYSSIGAVTACIQNDGHTSYLHSRDNPYLEAYNFAKKNVQPAIKSYAIYGVCLGYQLEALAECAENAVIHIYENNIEALYYLVKYADLANLSEKNNIRLYYDPDFQLLMQKLVDKECKFLIYYPALLLLSNPSIRESIETFFNTQNSIEEKAPLLLKNFKQNICLCNDIVDHLMPVFQNKDVYIIAAGPSLDKNINSLHKINRERSLILAVGKVYKKLVALQIFPDFVIESDPNARIVRHIQGLEDMQIPILLLSTAAKEISGSYKGKRYLILQNDFPPAEEYARKNQYHLYSTGGSVSTIALDVSLHLKAKRIIFLGLDLAFTDNMGHAAGTGGYGSINHSSDYMQIKSIHGNLVSTSKVLYGFHTWIEQRIRQVTDCELIDATEGGAYIKGMKVMTMKQILENKSDEPIL